MSRKIRNPGSVNYNVRWIVILLAAVVLLAPLQTIAQNEGSCSITRIRGEATALRQGQQIKLARGARISADDQIITGGRTRLRIACAGDADITIGPSSSVSLQELSGAETRRNFVIELIEGILRVTLAADPGRERFEVRTPTAVAAARSTEWITEAKADTTGVLVLHGSVAVSNRRTNVSVLVAEQQGTNVSLNAAPTPPSPWGQARAQSAQDRTSFR